MAALVTESGRKTPARLAGSAVLACQSDDRLVSLVRFGHERAFEAIVDRYRRPLLRQCRRILPESRAEDAVQQTFINAHSSLLDSADPVQLKPWLFAIARNASLNMLRQNGWNHEQIPVDFDGVPRPDQVYEQRVALEQTVSAMGALPERQREALVMRELEGRSYAEIAAALGANDGAVRQLLNRARGALRSGMTAVIPAPLVARVAAAGSPDGRRIAEIAGGLGAAGVAKAGATALVAGTLVVGAVNAPLPIVDHPKAADQGPHSVSADTGAPARAADVSARSAPVAGRSGHGGSGENEHSGRGGSGHSGSDDRNESGHRSGSDDGARSGSGSGDTRHSGSDDGLRTRSGSGTSGSGSDDSVTTGSHSGSGGGSDDAVASSGSGSGSSGSGGSDDGVIALSGSGSSGSGSGEAVSGSSSGPGFGDPVTMPVDDH
jgi:RNA polymerase sigma factor (sigma-70 family)